MKSEEANASAVPGCVEACAHALDARQAIDDPGAALGRGLAPILSGGSSEESLSVRHAAREALQAEGEAGRWRAPTRPTAEAVKGVSRPHGSVTT